MTDITLVKQHPEVIPESDRAAAHRVLFGAVDGLGETGKKQWRRFVNALFRLEPGEMVLIKTHRARLGWYHRKHMAMEARFFEAQERFDNFESFRTWLKVGAGFVDWYPGPKGGVIPVPRSISYATLGQDEMEQVHTDMVDFLRTEHAAQTLWKHLAQAARIEMVEMLLARSGEGGPTC